MTARNIITWDSQSTAERPLQPEILGQLTHPFNNGDLSVYLLSSFPFKWWVCFYSVISVFSVSSFVCLCYHMSHVTDALLSLHWLRVPERIQYKIAVLTYKVLHGTAPRYLGPLDRVADLHGRRALRSASSSRLVVPRFRLSTVDSRAFNISGPRIWNGLPEEVVSVPTLSSFRRWLKPFLFQQTYPDTVI